MPEKPQYEFDGYEYQDPGTQRTRNIAWEDADTTVELNEKALEKTGYGLVRVRLRKIDLETGDCYATLKEDALPMAEEDEGSWVDCDDIRLHEIFSQHDHY